MSETYEISVVCHNCKYVPVLHDPNLAGVKKTFAIPKGTEVQKFLREMTCENCGCDGFMGIL